MTVKWQKRRTLRTVAESMLYGRVMKHVVSAKKGECWNRTVAKIYKFGDGNAYSIIKIGGKNYKAHRVIYEIVFRKLTAGECVLHRCDNPSCCNPDHLFVGTQLDNIRDRDNKGRTADKRGIKNGRSDLTEDGVRFIRSSDKRVSVLAKKFKVSRQTVHEIKTGKKWKHVKGAKICL